MVLNQATDYALRITLFLAKQEEGQIVEASVIRSTELVPERFLFKIMRNLVKAGIVKSFRGKRGGFMLGRNPEDITIYNVIEALEGPIVLNHCLIDIDKCNKDAAGYCVIHRELAKLRNELIDRMQGINFKMLVDNE
ncbi:MAG: Rrf2 family transcriptional regulator [Clostridia bacterium]|jgi:Rrf2 family protein|nr:Rrf2 family transcriptional regulator [Clostridia bacterium]